MVRFTPVQDPEKARCEQDEESLRKHRQFDTPFALLKKDLNDKDPPRKDDYNPLGKPTGEVELDEQGLWRKKTAAFDKQWTWGRETVEYSDPERSRSEGNDGPEWGRPGTVGWGKLGKFGGRGEDTGLSVLQRAEVDQTMERNDRGLWVRKKESDETVGNTPSASSGCWRCSKCAKETSVSMEFCRVLDCGGVRPKSVNAESTSYRQSNPNEDPRLEAAMAKKRGTQEAAKQALLALESRRRQQLNELDKQGMMRRPIQHDYSDALSGGSAGREKDRRAAPSSSGGKQVRPAHRVNHCQRWQGVQRTDEQAKQVVGKAVGGMTAQSNTALRIEDHAKSAIRSTPKQKRDGEDVIGDLAEELERDRSRSRSRSKEDSPARSAPDVVVDFF